MQPEDRTGFDKPSDSGGLPIAGYFYYLLFSLFVIFSDSIILLIIVLLYYLFNRYIV